MFAVEFRGHPNLEVPAGGFQAKLNMYNNNSTVRRVQEEQKLLPFPFDESQYETLGIGSPYCCDALSSREKISSIAKISSINGKFYTLLPSASFW